MLRFAIAVCVSIVALGPAAARDLKVASWNLGWHMSKAEAVQWIRDCSQPFALNPATNLWEPSSSGPTKRGWELKWGRDAPIKWDIGRKPPCDVYQANFKIVPVTEAAYDKRIAQIRRYVEEKLDADILAFQEVSGEQAVREILPGNGAATACALFQASRCKGWSSSGRGRSAFQPTASLKKGCPSRARSKRTECVRDCRRP